MPPSAVLPDHAKVLNPGGEAGLPVYLAHHWEEYTYPVQDVSSRTLIRELKECLEPKGIYLLGRFAEWEYYNMDAAMGAALDLDKRLAAEQMTRG